MLRVSGLLVVLLIPGIALGQATSRAVEACDAAIARADEPPASSTARDVREGGPSAAARFVGRFYASAMDTERIDALGIAALQADLDRVESFQSSADVTTFIAEMHARGRFFLYRPGVAVNYRNSGIDVLLIAPGGLGLSRASYYLRSDPRSVVVRETYREHVSTMLALANIYSNSGLDRAAPDPDLQTDRILDMETRLATASMGLNEHVLVNDIGAAATTPSIDWYAYTTGLGAGTGEFLFPDGPFFAEVEKMLRELTMEDWKAYLRWHLLRTAAPYIASPFADEHARFYQTFLSGVRQDEPRWRHAQRMVLTVALPALDTFDETRAPFHAVPDDYLGNVLRGRAFAAQRTFARVGAPARLDESTCRAGE